MTVRLVLHATSGRGDISDASFAKSPVVETRLVEALRSIPPGKRPMDRPTWSPALDTLEPCGKSLADVKGGPGPVSMGYVLIRCI